MANSVDLDKQQKQIEKKRILIVIALWTTSFLRCGILKSIGVLLPVLKEQFETYTGTVGIVVSFANLSGNIMGKSASFKIVCVPSTRE